MTALEQIDKLIESVRGLIKIPGNPKYEHPLYRGFHDTLTVFIYENHLEENKHWAEISKNLMYQSDQYMDLGEANSILVSLENIKRILLSQKYEQFWEYIHPKIEAVARDRFYNGMYADAIESSFKEINNRVKEITKKQTGQELDGSALMKKVFSVNNPTLIIQDITTTTGNNVQLGYMEIFAGAMTGIRNPKAHGNQVITREDAIRKLNFASLLMYKVDQAIKSTGIRE